MSVSLQACLFKFSLSISTPEMSLQSTIQESGMYLMQMQNSGAFLLVCMSLPYGGRKRRDTGRMWGKCITLRLKDSPSPVCFFSRVCVRCMDVRLFCTDPAPLQLCPACCAFRLEKYFFGFVAAGGEVVWVTGILKVLLRSLLSEIL